MINYYAVHEHNCGLLFCETKQEAIEVANKLLSEYREESHADGEWNDDVESIVILKVVKRVELVDESIEDAEYYDAKLIDCEGG